MKAIVFEDVRKAVVKDAPIPTIGPREVWREPEFALRNTFAPAIRLIQNRVVQVSPLLSHAFAFEQFEEALKIMRSGDSMKVQLHP